ncbi:hypothetical protein TTHERM_00143680 (macronuclear) [Tetrahymena thermophila SB210]|uniref:Uncharacterized protein n=1 Tax=Tetrahymena thermophila (strain SB210) TaxID=312017 RepID=I7M7A5_TETTS|nr:hypothetical protein TTHERM_00143680 [Tetrahymena thermophila SB210]EAR90862.2 hypothetical protein TTHERM_00143680 [Tetrahymena thermophila SB210]|eukprot:XP_001011107.2 hypothetical protein TTHERM_00143680 [Tetrahymena thermophila SB210]
MSDYRQEVEKKLSKRSQSNEVSMIVQDILNQNNQNNNTQISYHLQTGPLSANTTFNQQNILNSTFNRRKESARASYTNIMDRSWIGKQDKDGILIYCNELNRQIEQKNQELNKAYKECSIYKVAVEQKIQECLRDGSNPLNPVVELLQKERNDLKSEIIELSASENFLKDEISRLEQEGNQKEKILREYEAFLESKDKTILELKDKFELDQKKNEQLNHEIINFQEVYDSKEKLQAQLENRIYVLEQENMELRARLENTEMEYKGYLGQFEGEKTKILEENQRFNNLKDNLSETFSVIGQFINDFSKVTKLKNVQSITVDSFHKMISQFDFNVQTQEVESIDFLQKWIVSLFEQVEFQTNMILKLEEEAEANNDRIKDLQKDLYESVNIGRIFKEKEIKLLKEIEMIKRNYEEDRGQIQNNLQKENQFIIENEQTKNEIRNLTEQLQTAHEQVQNLHEEMETSQQLHQAKEQQEKILKETIDELQNESERMKNQKEIFQNALFKLCHILPHVELEQLIKDFIQNSEQLYLAQIEQEQQELQFQENDEDLKKSVKEDTLNSRQIISKRKVVEQVRENLKNVVSKCRKLRERESYILNEIDKISQLEKQRIEKSLTIEREFYKMKSLMQYEQKRNEALMRQADQSPNTILLKNSNIYQQSPNYSDIQSQRNQFLSSNDLDYQKQSEFNNKENERDQNIKLKTEDDQQSQQIYNQIDRLDAQSIRNKIAKQQSLSRQISASMLDVNKDKIINNLLSSNISLRNNVTTLKNSSSLNNLNLNYGKKTSIDIQYSMLGSQDKNAMLRMKLEDKLMNSKRNLGLTYKQNQL